MTSAGPTSGNTGRKNLNNFNVHIVHIDNSASPDHSCASRMGGDPVTQRIVAARVTRWLPPTRITRPFPEARFAATLTQGKSPVR